MNYLQGLSKQLTPEKKHPQPADMDGLIEAGPGEQLWTWKGDVYAMTDEERSECSQIAKAIAAGFPAPEFAARGTSFIEAATKQIAEQTGQKTGTAS